MSDRKTAGQQTHPLPQNVGFANRQHTNFLVTIGEQQSAGAGSKLHPVIALEIRY